MSKFACRYAIVQFMPYVETGEFANVGVVLVCPHTGYFGFQLQTRRYARITAFFDELKARVYLEAIKALEHELARIAGVVKTSARTGPTDAQQLRDLFIGLVHPREAILRFGQPRSLLTTAPEAAVGELFRHYVEREFVTHEYLETAMEKQLKGLLKDITLPAPFQHERVGNDEFHAAFPFVQKQEGAITKIIKPFNLSQEEPNRIYEHGDPWIQKMKRLRSRGLLPDDVLFTVAEPPSEDRKRVAACNEIIAELREQKILVAPANDHAQVIQFAKR